MKQITSRDNALLRRVRRLLTSAAARRDEHTTLLDGPHLLQAYLACYPAAQVDLVVSQSSVVREEIAALIAQVGSARTFQVPDALFKSLSPTEHPVGILASVPIPSTNPLPALTPASEVDCLLLDGVQDPGNVGALLRTACAAGFLRVYLSPGCADPWSPKCLRGGMGAQFHLHLVEDADLLAVVTDFGGLSLACDGQAERSLFELPLRSPLAVLMGAEGAGLRPALLAAATQRCRIPMLGGVESLNVGAAAAVVMYEQVRRRVCAP